MDVRESSGLRLVVVGYGPTGHHLVEALRERDLGTRDPTVASPMCKQVFDLRTGRCLDDRDQAVPNFAIRRSLAGDRVEVALP